MKLYHGTNERVARLALKEGLKPRELTGAAGHWKHTVDSNPSHVYLSTVYAPYFALSAARDGELWGIVEVDTDLLDRSRMRPDEDFLEQITRGRRDMPGPRRAPMEERTRWFRERLETFAQHWEMSLDHLGTASHRGPLPPSAITRVAIFEPSSNKDLWMAAADPCITLMNYQVCRDRYGAITRWLIGDEVKAEDYAAWSWAVLPEEQRKRTADTLKRRHGWKLIFSRDQAA